MTRLEEAGKHVEEALNTVLNEWLVKASTWGFRLRPSEEHGWEILAPSGLVAFTMFSKLPPDDHRLYDLLDMMQHDVPTDHDLNFGHLLLEQLDEETTSQAR